MSSAATDPRPSDPRHRVRATRTAGRAMRSRLLDAASRLFREKGLAGVSIADIAEAADAFPSQITYYFRTKEALFVEAACRDVGKLGNAFTTFEPTGPVGPPVAVNGSNPAA